MFVGGRDSKAYALDVESGETIWEFGTPDLVSCPAIWNDLVIIGSWGIYALAAATGKKMWSFENDILTMAGPVIWNDLVLVASGTLCALQASSGKVAWKTNDIGVLSQPSVSEFGRLDWPMFRGNPQQTGVGIRSS